MSPPSPTAVPAPPTSSAKANVMAAKSSKLPSPISPNSPMISPWSYRGRSVPSSRLRANPYHRPGRLQSSMPRACPPSPGASSRTPPAHANSIAEFQNQAPSCQKRQPQFSYATVGRCPYKSLGYKRQMPVSSEERLRSRSNLTPLPPNAEPTVAFRLPGVRLVFWKHGPIEPKLGNFASSNATKHSI